MFRVLLAAALVTATGALFDAEPSRAHAQQGPTQPSPSSSRSQWSGIYTEAQARRGESLYAANCAFCHGATLEGTEGAPPLRGDMLFQKWNGRPLTALFELQRVTMPWHSPGGFSREKNADLIAYLLLKGNAPAGSSELSSQPDALAEITILARQP